jgi:hypothetical protein
MCPGLPAVSRGACPDMTPSDRSCPETKCGERLQRGLALCAPVPAAGGWRIKSLRIPAIEARCLY